MAGKGHLLLHRKNSDPHSAFPFGGRSRGKTNVVSERFISRARACMSWSLSPRPSENTARELPSNGREEKTSNCTKGKRRSSGDMTIYCSVERASEWCFSFKILRRARSITAATVLRSIHHEPRGESRPRLSAEQRFASCSRQKAVEPRSTGQPGAALSAWFVEGRGECLTEFPGPRILVDIMQKRSTLAVLGCCTRTPGCG